MNNIFTKQIFTIDTGDQEELKFIGYSNGDCYSAGFSPYFDKEEANKIAETYSDLTYNEKDDTFVLNDKMLGEESIEIFKGIDIEYQGSLIHVYQIGEGWTWIPIKIIE